MKDQIRYETALTKNLCRFEVNSVKVRFNKAKTYVEVFWVKGKSFTKSDMLLIMKYNYKFSFYTSDGKNVNELILNKLKEGKYV